MDAACFELRLKRKLFRVGTVSWDMLGTSVFWSKFWLTGRELRAGLGKRWIGWVEMAGLSTGFGGGDGDVMVPVDTMVGF